MMPAAALALVLLSSAPALGPQGLPEGWEPLTFRKVERRTRYAWDEGERALHAVADASASGLLRRLDAPAQERPILRWRWRVKGSLPRGDERAKSGDDYAARLYVTFRYDPSRAGAGLRLKYGIVRKLYGEYPPHSGINYVWANKLPAGKSLPNAYTDRVMMVAARSGDAEARRWLQEERDIVADYRELFGQEPPPLSGVAVMTDADDTGDRAEAWFADVELRPR